MDHADARQIARVELGLDHDGGRPVTSGTHENYVDRGYSLLHRLQDRDEPVDYSALARLAREDGRGTGTVEQWRVCLRYTLAHIVLELDREADQFRGDGDHDGADWSAEKSLEAALALADLAEPREGASRYKSGKRKSAGDRARDALVWADKHASERGYADWRRDLIEHAPDYLALAMHVQAVSGCRPTEIPGVVIRALDGRKLEITVPGAKVDRSGRRGQPSRTLVLSGSCDPLLDELWESVSEREYATLRDVPTSRTSNYPANAYCRAVIDLAKSLGYKGVSANCFRHQLGSDLRGNGDGEKGIARALGHVSQRSQRTYGRPRDGRKGMITLESAKADRPIREKESTAEIEARVPAADDDDAPDIEPE